jgi:hypothetical protein
MLSGQGVVHAITGAPMPSRIARAQVNRNAQTSRYRGSTLGNFTGDVLATLPAMFVPGGPIVQEAAGGALMTENPDDHSGLAGNALLGAVGGKAGQILGKHVLAPVAERIGRTQVGQAIGSAARNAMTAATGWAPRALPAPVRPVIDKAIGRVAPDAAKVQRNLADAQRLGLPYSLADASPEFRVLAGSVARKSPVGRTLAEETFAPRGRGQADRAIQAIDERLAPYTNIEQRAGDIRTAASDASKPLYRKC